MHRIIWTGRNDRMPRLDGRPFTHSGVTPESGGAAELRQPVLPKAERPGPQPCVLPVSPLADCA
jgi:hypothetical protein